jgi:quinol monooxygenase YgiN
VSRHIGRRDVIVIAGSAAFAVLAPGCAPVRERQPQQEQKRMYGIIGKMTTVPGKRDEFISILLESTGAMPGCLSYVIAKDPTEPDAIWITEVWDSEESHRASLALPAVRAAIARGKPLIAGFGNRSVTEPVGGHGLVSAGARST